MLMRFLLLSAIALCGCSTPPQPSPEWGIPSLTSYASPGREAVQVREFDLENAELGKRLPVRLSFPKASGSYPVVLFSHGAYSSKNYYDLILDHWASHGYVVIAPTHRDSTALGVKRGDPTIGQHWPERVADLSFLLDAVPEMESRFRALAGKADFSRVAATGHSLGGLTAMALAGAQTFADAGNRRVSYRDSRVSVGVFVSPPGAMPTLIDSAGFSTINVPALYTTATNDIIMMPDTTWEWHKDGYAAAQGGSKYLLVLKGADHYLGGVVGRDDLQIHPMSDDFMDAFNGLSTAFLDHYLKQSQRAGEMLEGSHRLISPTVALVERK